VLALVGGLATHATPSLWDPTGLVAGHMLAFLAHSRGRIGKALEGDNCVATEQD
jgi:hypothetical protein